MVITEKENLEIKKHEHTFLELVQLDEVEGIERLNFIYQANLLKTVLFQRNFVPAFSYSVAIGSNAILKAMKRRYQREVYTERVNKIREVMPRTYIGVDHCWFSR
jgi:threonylcarbamoyladenosine tRNA methylthiotransferase MtaB